MKYRGVAKLMNKPLRQIDLTHYVLPLTGFIHSAGGDAEMPAVHYFNVLCTLSHSDLERLGKQIKACLARPV